MNEDRPASEVIWNWKQRAGSNKKPNYRADRLHGVIQAAVGIGMGFLVRLWHPLLSIFVFSVAGAILLAALLSPGFLYQKFKAGAAAFGRGVGFVMTWFLLLPVYYLFFTPFHWIFRTGRRDAMQRSLNPEADSYWIVREAQARSAETYERQF